MADSSPYVSLRMVLLFAPPKRHARLMSARAMVKKRRVSCGPVGAWAIMVVLCGFLLCDLERESKRREREGKGGVRGVRAGGEGVRGVRGVSVRGAGVRGRT